MSDYIPIREAASKLGCSEETVRRMIRSGQLPALRMQQQYRINERDLVLALTTTYDNSQQRTTTRYNSQQLATIKRSR